MSSSHSSQFPPKSIVKNKSYEGVEALRQIASTSLFLDNEQQPQQRHATIIPTIKEPLDEGSSNASLTNLMSQAQDALLEPPIEMTKMSTLQVDTLNVIDILSLTDEETEREIRQIDINQEVMIPRVEPSSLFDDRVFSDDIDAVEELHIDEVDSEKRTSNKLNRQRTSLNQSKTAKDGDTLLMETSLTIMDTGSLSPPPYTPPPLPLSPNIVTTTFNLPPSTLSLTLPLENTTTTTEASNQQPTTSSASKKHRHHHHSHSHHHHKGSQHKHRHSTAIGRTAPIVDEHGQPIKDSHQITEAELVLSPSKLGQ